MMRNEHGAQSANIEACERDLTRDAVPAINDVQRVVDDYGVCGRRT